MIAAEQHTDFCQIMGRAFRINIIGKFYQTGFGVFGIAETGDVVQHILQQCRLLRRIPAVLREDAAEKIVDLYGGGGEVPEGGIGVGIGADEAPVFVHAHFVGVGKGEDAPDAARRVLADVH